jgi:hypothetical protein
MTGQSIHWLRAALGTLTAEVGQIAAAVLWVTIYSYIIAPGQSIEAYQAYAQRSGPWVAVIAGAAIFYAAARWIARSKPTAMALFGLFLLLDLALFAVMPPAAMTPMLLALFSVSYFTKALLCYLGGKHAETARNRRAEVLA